MPFDLRQTPVSVGPHRLQALLGLPEPAAGLIIFAHGSGSGRLSPRNNYVARGLQKAGFATLLLDLLTTEEESNRANVFDIELLASRLIEASQWASSQPSLSRLKIGYFGASTGAGAALTAAALGDGRIGAIVSRGGRPDLAGEALARVRAPTQLLVGSLDREVLDLNSWALTRLRCPKELVVIPGASHLFEEPGTLDMVLGEAIRWFDANLRRSDVASFELPFSDRREAGRVLARSLQKFREDRPLVLALPRGGVPVAFEVAKALDSELDLLLVRKLGSPGNPEVGIGAIVDGEEPQIVLNREIVGHLSLPSGYIHDEARHQLLELEHRRQKYLGGRAPLPVKGRTVIVVDDGIATGGTVRAALRGLRKKEPSKLILAVPVAPLDALSSLRPECDEIVCAATPDPFHAVGAHYADFSQTSDEEVKHLLQVASSLEPAAH